MQELKHEFFTMCEDGRIKDLFDSQLEKYRNIDLEKPEQLRSCFCGCPNFAVFYNKFWYWDPTVVQFLIQKGFIRWDFQYKEFEELGCPLNKVSLVAMDMYHGSVLLHRLYQNIYFNNILYGAGKPEDQYKIDNMQANVILVLEHFITFPEARELLNYFEYVQFIEFSGSHNNTPQFQLFEDEEANPTSIWQAIRDGVITEENQEKYRKVLMDAGITPSYPSELK